MRLIVDLEEDGPVTPEIVRQSVEYAIRDYRAKNGLSADEDEGMINSIEVTVDTSVPDVLAHAAEMKLSDALDIVLNLAEQNVIDDDDMEEEAERQTAAIELVRQHHGRP
jgi:hypothetical protein